MPRSHVAVTLVALMLIPSLLPITDAAWTWAPPPCEVSSPETTVETKYDVETCDDGGGSSGSGTDSRIVNVELAGGNLSAGVPYPLSIRCKGTCASTGEIDFHFLFNGKRAWNRTDINWAHTGTTNHPDGTRSYHYMVRLPRTQSADLHIEFVESGRRYYATKVPLGEVRNGQAEFYEKPTTTVAYRGVPVTIDSTRKEYFQDARFRFDPDQWDRDAMGTTQGALQSFTWTIPGAEDVVRTAFTQEDTSKAEWLAVTRTYTTLSRGNCADVTVTTTDVPGQLAESNNSEHKDSVYVSSATPREWEMKRTKTVERICVENRAPMFEVNSPLPDPSDSAGVVFVITSLMDADEAAGYDRLLVQAWNRAPSGAPSSGTLVQEWDWSTIKNDPVLRLPAAAFPDGAALCVMDLEKQTTLDGQHRTDVPNMQQPICRLFAAPLVSQAPPVNSVIRLTIEAGPTRVRTETRNGALLDVREVVPYDAGNPGPFLTTLRTILESAKNAGTGRDRCGQVVIAVPGIGTDQTLDKLLVDLTAMGVLVIVPAGLPDPLSAGISPYWEIRGLAAHPDVLTVGAAWERGTDARLMSAYGPNALMRLKPEVTVLTPDALDDAAAQVAAVGYAADLALWYELRGISDPTLVKALVKRLALPLHGENGTLGIASETGVGALDPARFSANKSLLSRQTLPYVDLDASVGVAGAATATNLSALPGDALLDVGVVHHQEAKSGSFGVVNLNGMLARTLRTHEGNLSAAMPAGAPADAGVGATLRVTVNVTFYSILDLLENNLTQETTRRETRDRVAELDRSRTFGGAPDPYRLTDAERAALNLTMETLEGLVPAHHFIPEVTVDVPPTPHGTTCAAPSLLPLEHYLNGVLLYMDSGGFSERTSISTAWKNAKAVQWGDCVPALGAVKTHLATIRAGLVSASANATDTYLATVLTRYDAETLALERMVNGSIERAAPLGSFKVPLSTDPARTSVAKLGPYVGVVRITTHDLCHVNPSDLAKTSCSDASEYALASLWIQGADEFILRDRAGRAMPGRAVTLQYLPPGTGNCADVTPSPYPSRVAALLDKLYSLGGEHAGITDANGMVRFLNVRPGYYDLHDGYVGFPVRVKYAENGSMAENLGFREYDCNLPVGVHLEQVDSLAVALDTATSASCVFKVTGLGIPAVSARKALAARSAGQVASPACETVPVTSASAQAGLVALDLAQTKIAALSLEPVERWQMVFPQVQNGRMVDNVSGFDINVTNLGAPGPGEWQFTRTDSAVRADVPLQASGIGVFQYDFKVPPNEELAHFWTFSVEMANTEGLAIFTLRDDSKKLIDLVKSRQPTTAIDLATYAAANLNSTGFGGMGPCSMPAHYRIVPLTASGGTMSLSGVPGLGDDVINDGAQVQLSGMGTRAEVSRFARFHTRECLADDVHVLFLFWQRPVRDIDLGVKFEIYNQRIYTWAGVGGDYPGAPGPWGTIKLPRTHDPLTPYHLDTATSSAYLGVDTFEPKAEGWDLFVDTVDAAQWLEVAGKPAATSRLIVRKLDRASTTMFPEAPDGIDSMAMWVKELEKAGYAVNGLPPVGRAETESYHQEGAFETPNRHAAKADDRAARGRVAIAASAGEPCVFNVRSQFDGRSIYGDSMTPTRAVHALQLLWSTATLPSSAPPIAAGSWTVTPKCASTAQPRTYFNMLHVTREAAAETPTKWSVLEHITSSPGEVSIPAVPTATFPYVAKPWVPGNESRPQTVRLNLEVGLAELLRDPTRLGIRGAAAWQDGSTVYGISIQPGRLLLTATPTGYAMGTQVLARERDKILGTAPIGSHDFTPVTEVSNPEQYIRSAAKRVVVSWDPAAPTTRPIIETCDGNDCTVVSREKVDKALCTWVCPPPGVEIPPVGNLIELIGLEESPVSCRLAVQRPQAVQIWHPLANREVRIGPWADGGILDPCHRPGVALSVIEGEAMTWDTLRCYANSRLSVPDASGGAVLNMYGSATSDWCAAIFSVPSGSAVQAASVRFQLFPWVGQAACGRWEAMVGFTIVGTSPEACAMSRTFTEASIFFTAPVTGTVKLAWRPNTADTYQDERVYLDKVDLLR